MSIATATDPHAHSRVLRAGSSLDSASGVLILLHGRGATAEDILSVAGELDLPQLAYIAPQASGATWYPYSFLSPVERNEPYLSSALGLVSHLVTELIAAGLPRQRIAIGGFSQGACLALEHAARNPDRYGAVLGFSGGLVGERICLSAYSGRFAGTRVFLGCDEHDPHIPAGRVSETAALLTSMGATVTLEFYRHMGHSINEEEILIAQSLLAQMTNGSS